MFEEVSRAFKKKVPVEIRTAPAFQMSDATGIKLADMAQTMYSNLKTTGSLVNTFSTTKPFKKTVTFRDQKPQFQRYNCGSHHSLMHKCITIALRIHLCLMCSLGTL